MPILALNEIRTNGGTQTRAALQDDAVNDYAEALEDGAKFPPVTVFYDGSAYWLADGFHRFRAHEKCGALEIDADVKQGERRDAVLFSVGANQAHGARRTNEDKRRAVSLLLEDQEWSQWSDREIARRAGVGNQLVGHVRATICVNHTDKTERKVKRGDTEYIMQVPAKTESGTANLQEATDEKSPSAEPEFTAQTGSQIESLVAGGQIAQLDKPLLTNEEIWESLPDEAKQAASKPLPDETPHTVLQQVVNSPEYKLSERVGKLLNSLASYEPGKVHEGIYSNFGRAARLPQLAKHVAPELHEETFDDQNTITV